MFYIELIVMNAQHAELRTVYPFTAIVDQERLKLALLLNAINPRIRGVLVRGAKGTGKSTAVRALIDLLPEVEVVEEGILLKPVTVVERKKAWEDAFQAIDDVEDRQPDPHQTPKDQEEEIAHMVKDFRKHHG